MVRAEVGLRRIIVQAGLLCVLEHGVGRFRDACLQRSVAIVSGLDGVIFQVEVLIIKESEGADRIFRYLVFMRPINSRRGIIKAVVSRLFVAI